MATVGIKGLKLRQLSQSDRAFTGAVNFGVKLFVKIQNNVRFIPLRRCIDWRLDEQICQPRVCSTRRSLSVLTQPWRLVTNVQESLANTKATKCATAVRAWRLPSEEMYGLSTQGTMLESTFCGLQRCRWQYGSIFIRLAVVQNCEIRAILRKCELIPLQSPRSSILVPIESAYATSY